VTTFRIVTVSPRQVLRSRQDQESRHDEARSVPVATDQVDQLSAVLDVTGRLVAGVRDEQWADPTPCSEWNVRDLVSHIVASNRLFTAILTHSEPPGPADPVSAPARLVRAYQDSAPELVAAFSQPGVLDEVFTVPFATVPGAVALHLRIIEMLMHGWDVARATGQPAEFPADITEQELAFSRSIIGQIPPGRQPFAPSLPDSDEAPAIDRLAALLGRDAIAWAQPD
jgi:uncharacterized protein (TIGR03086 family)